MRVSVVLELSGQLVTVGGQDVIVYSVVVVIVEVVQGVSVGDVVLVTGQTVVEVMTEEVFDPTGQLVTVGAQDVMVYSTVE